MEMKQIKLESVYKDAYIDRYRRLGYTVASVSESTKDGKTWAVINFERDMDDPSHEKLAKLEAEVDELCEMARAAAGAPDDEKKNRKRTLFVMFITGIAAMAAGLVLVLSGLFAPSLGTALGGWCCVVAGAVLTIVWSCLREKWRLRKIDIIDDVAHPGFGVDEYSRKVEECLKQADAERAAAEKRIGELAHGTDSRHGTATDTEISRGYPCVVNDPALTALAAALARSAGFRVEMLPLRTTAEDFGYYTTRYPALFYRLGVGAAAGRTHTALFNPDEGAIDKGIGFMTDLALQISKS